MSDALVYLDSGVVRLEGAAGQAFRERDGKARVRIIQSASPIIIADAHSRLGQAIGEKEFTDVTVQSDGIREKAAQRVGVGFEVWQEQRGGKESREEDG